ncbi:MAG TPA: MFS transporter [Dehalococcoidia bacterium]|nr:MFS transporter [Dehalococcoidia bacterium]
MHAPPPQLSPLDRAHYELNIQLFYGFRFLREAQLWIPIWIVYLIIDRGFSLSQIGIADAVFLIGLTLLEVPTGAIADRFGRSISLALGAGFLAISIAIFGLTTSFPILLASFLTWSLAETLLSGADLALVYDSLKALGREDEYEKQAGRGEAFMWGGATLGVLIGGPVAQLVSTEFTIFLGVGTTASMIFLALAMREPPRHETDGVQTGYLEGARRAISLVWRLPSVRSAMLYSAALIAGLEATGYLLQPFLLDKGQEVGVTFSLLQVPGLLAGVLGSLLAFRIVTRAGTVPVFVVIPIVGVGAYAGLALIDALGAVAFFPIILLLRSTVQPIATGYINRRVPSDQRATILSLQSLMIGLLLAPFSASVGIIFDEVGLQWAFAVPGIALAALALTTGSVWVRAHRREIFHPPEDAKLEPVPPGVIAPVLSAHPGDPGM